MRGINVTRYVHLVFSDPPTSVADDDYNTWYDAHVQEILAIEGWESATRFTVEGVVGADRSVGYRYLSLYELSCPPAQAVANLEAANMGSADSYVEKKDTDEGNLPLPDWFTEITFGSWNCIRVSDRITPFPHATEPNHAEPNHAEPNDAEPNDAEPNDGGHQ
jgi:hypothetical protein